jgi:hypothetical protein
VADEKVWNVSNLIITGMGVIIAALISAGYFSLTSKIETGDALIYSRMGEMKNEIKGVSDWMVRMQADITRIDTLQKIRLERDVREENRKNGSR